MSVLSNDRSTLDHLLDEKLKQYLQLLDRYTVAREDLNRALSSGYFALAQANFSNPNRIRYGQDFYDDRMKATTQIVCSAVPSPDARFAVEKAIGKDKLAPVDPLKWFGVLTPPTLKASQHDFQTAVLCVARVASLSADMEDLEIEVRRVRKKLSKLR